MKHLVPKDAFYGYIKQSWHRYWGLNQIAVELENPFGDDPNDLPLPETHDTCELAQQPSSFSTVSSRVPKTMCSGAPPAHNASHLIFSPVAKCNAFNHQ